MKARHIKRRMAARYTTFFFLSSLFAAAGSGQGKSLYVPLDRATIVPEPKTEHEYAIHLGPKSAPKIRVVRKKDGVLYDVFDTMAEAEAIIAKAKARKKATLIVQELEPVPAQ